MPYNKIVIRLFLYNLKSLTNVLYRYEHILLYLRTSNMNRFNVQNNNNIVLVIISFKILNVLTLNTLYYTMYE